MKNQLRLQLGRLASIEFQRRLCVGGTKDEYILPSEILESTANTVQTTLTSPVLSKQFNAPQLAALREFLEVANAVAQAVAFDSESHSVEELVENNPDWRTLRTTAQKCLDVLGLKPSLDELLNRS
jgi:hypothetical protein